MYMCIFTYTLQPNLYYNIDTLPRLDPPVSNIRGGHFMFSQLHTQYCYIYTILITILITTRTPCKALFACPLLT